MALLRPARRVAEAEVVGVAARDPKRALAFARKHSIPQAFESYEALLADPEIDAVYNPLPNALHCEWTVRALEAGKHVLCEKPLASNAAEAERMAEAAEKSGRALVEAFHWRYHPLAARLVEIVRNELGAIRRVETAMCVPFVIPGDIRYRYELGGGALMDVGCYAISLLRHLSGEEPEVVTSAHARLSAPNVDRYVRADFRLPSGAAARITCSLFSAVLLRIGARMIGEAGELRVLNPVAPHLLHRVTIRDGRGWRTERVNGESTYTHQLRAFVAHVRDGQALPTDARDGVANMRVIDAVYDRAGLPRRGESS